MMGNIIQYDAPVKPNKRLTPLGHCPIAPSNRFGVDVFMAVAAVERNTRCNIGIEWSMREEVAALISFFEDFKAAEANGGDSFLPPEIKMLERKDISRSILDYNHDMPLEVVKLISWYYAVSARSLIDYRKLTPQELFSLERHMNPGRYLGY